MGVGEEREDFDEAFRELSRAIFASLEAALGAAPKGHVWPLAHPLFGLKKLGDDEYCLVLGKTAEEDMRLNRKEAVALTLMYMAKELVKDG